MKKAILNENIGVSVVYGEADASNTKTDNKCSRLRLYLTESEPAVLVKAAVIQRKMYTKDRALLAEVRAKQKNARK